MDWKKDRNSLGYMLGFFLIAYFLPVGWNRFDNAVFEALNLLKEYAREHVLTCLLPAFFIAGAISVFLSQASVMKYLGAQAKKVIAYGVASVSGSILAVCSCTVLPLFAGIYRMGAGIGPATAFLYSGPAINVLAIILTARILGLELGIARAAGAVVFSIVIGLLMHLIYGKKEHERTVTTQASLNTDDVSRPLWQTTLYFASMVGILIFANWGKPADNSGLWSIIHSWKWIITSGFSILLGLILTTWFNVKLWKLMIVAAAITVSAVILPGYPVIAFAIGLIGFSTVLTTGNRETQSWFDSTFGFAKQILPLLFAGVLVAGALLGRPGNEGLIPSEWVSSAVGGNSITANLFASIAGAFMYFATLTEVPILQGLLGAGMGKGPALALLLAGPALSLPNMLVIRSIMGTSRTITFISLVVIMATISGTAFGLFSG
ncbi:MAG: permease [Candidatus Aegiribacteria sp.]|nr:permease [Candidatus Aegiribacteria sp.]